MKYRTATLLAPTDMVSASGTRTIDINVADVISRIVLQWIITKAQVGMDSYPHTDIAKIELVDGSEVLHSLNGGQNQALCIFDRKCSTMNHGQYINANSQRSLYAIDFGRFLFDPVLALDPKRFRNLQLKITYNEAVSDTSATVDSLEVIAECFDERVVTPMGFLSAKEHYSYTPASSGVYEYVQLPTDNMLRKMLIQGYKKAYEPWYQVTEARLDEDNDKRIPFDWNLERYYQFRKSIDTPVEEAVAIQASGAGTKHYLQATDYWSSLILNGQGAGDEAGIGASGRGGYFLVVPGGSTQLQGVQRGWLPNHCFQFPFGDQQDMDDWYDVSKVGSLRLRLKSGDGYATSAVAVVLQQLRRY